MVTSNPPSIIIENASLRYNDKLIFDHLNFYLPGGQFTALLGPSGVGKTTLLRLLAGIVSTNAQVSTTIMTSDKQPLHGRITYMAQTDLLLPWHNVLDNVLVGKQLRGKKISDQDRNYAHSLLQQVDLPDAATKMPSELSGGMRQRVALARTLMEDKPIVLMDEPFAAVDAITRLKLQEITAKLLINRTVLLITHDPLEALRLGQRVHVMAGQPATLDKPLELTGVPPRDPGDPELLIYQAELLRRLTSAKAAVT